MGKKTPSRRYAMRPIVNMLEEDRGTDTEHAQKKFSKDFTCGSGDILTLRNRSCWWSKYLYASLSFCTLMQKLK